VSQAKKQNKNGISVNDRAYLICMTESAARYFFIGFCLVFCLLTGYCSELQQSVSYNSIKSISTTITPKGSYFDAQIRMEMNPVNMEFEEKIWAWLTTFKDNVKNNSYLVALTRQDGLKYSGKAENIPALSDRIVLTTVAVSGNTYTALTPNDTVYKASGGEEIPVVSIVLIPDFEGPVLLNGTTDIGGPAGDEFPLSINTLWSDRGLVSSGNYRIIPPTYFAPENHELCQVRKACVYVTGDLRINSANIYNLTGSNHFHNFWRSGEYVFEFSAYDRFSYRSSYYFFPSLSTTHYVTAPSLAGQMTNVPIIKRMFVPDPQVEDMTPPALSNIYLGTPVPQSDGNLRVPITTEWIDQHIDASSRVSFKSCFLYGCGSVSFSYAGGNLFRYSIIKAIGATITVEELKASDHAGNVTLYYTDETRSTTHYMILATGMGTAQISTVPIFRQVVNP
jgi:hypothetical protein